MRLTQKRSWRTCAASLLSLLALGMGVFSGPVHAGARFSHAPWDQLLKKNWRDAKLPYAKLKADSKLLDHYLLRASEADPSAWTSREEKLAFWINLYNACTLRVILDSYPLTGDSKVDQIALKGPQGEAWNIWQKPFCKVKDRVLTLDQIEREVLIGELNEPLVHFAINCGALSCPNLRKEAYVPERVRVQMQEQARAFLKDPTRNQFEIKSKQIRLSMIFGWYGEDFQKAAGGSLTKFLVPYVSKDLRRWIEDPSVKVDYLEYNWTLNDLVSKVNTH
jgi:hypothetical protein